MSPKEFSAYRRAFVNAMQRCLEDAKCPALYEAGFPAYAQANPLASLVFWTRVRIVAEYVDGLRPFDRALDFGCWGV
jgi:hypothetical protein